MTHLGILYQHHLLIWHALTDCNLLFLSSKPTSLVSRLLPQPCFPYMGYFSSCLRKSEEQDAFSMPSSSTSHQQGEDRHAFSGIEPHDMSRKVSLENLPSSSSSSLASSSSSHQENEERHAFCMASSSWSHQENEERHAFSMASSSSSRHASSSWSHQGNEKRHAFSSHASSSSSHPQNEERYAFSGIEPHGMRRKVSESSRLFDVFINHRGPDVKNTLALELYNSLKSLDVRAFLDSEEKELGDSFPSIIETAICSAAVHVAIFSKGYAESPWCLAELVLMLQSKAKIIPVFYDVEPSALRHIEKGVYASAFIQYHEKSRYLEKLEEWKAALQSISFIAGEEVNSDCKKIVSAVQKEVQRKKCLTVAKYPVGLPKLVEHFEKQCIDKVVQDFESQCGMNKQEEGKAMIVGIFGMGGVGKTTLSKEFFNRKRSDYSRSCFLFDVREASAKSGLPSLQMKLLRDLFDEGHQSFQSLEDGTSCLSDRIRRRDTLSFLIVLDDIDHLEQLDVLLIGDVLNKSGNSLVIVTTRDVGVLINAGITVGYNLKGLDTDDAKELFCWHAFRQPYPSNGYEKLVALFVHLCGGLPLSLQVLGRHVHGTDQNFWELELKKVKKTLPHEIQKRLRISIDTLDNEEKQIFMDVACFFIGELKKDAIRVWEGSGWNAKHALRRLKNKCLVEEMEDINFRWQFPGLYTHSREEMLVLRMHDHLRDLGREMADELNHPRRPWRSQYCESLISKGFHNILPQTKGRCLHSLRGPSMSLIKYFLAESDNMAATSTAVLWLELSLFEHTLANIPPWIPLQNLQSLRIIGGGLRRLWQNDAQAPFPLKDLQICRISELEELSLGFLRCLEIITIYDCGHLKSVTGISNLRKLVELNIGKCGKLEELSFVQVSRVEKIRIFDCPYLKSVTGIADLRKLVDFSIVKCPILEVEELCFLQQSRLKNIMIADFPHLKCVTGISDLRKLVELQIRECPKLEELSLVRLTCLEKINICCPKLKSITVSHLTKLVELNITSCWNLKSIEVIGCKNLRIVPKYFLGLEKLNICDCPELEKIGVKLSSLTRMQLLYCSNETIRNCIVKMKRLPSDFVQVIGRAVDGPESTLNSNIFSDANISRNSVIEIGTDNTYLDSGLVPVILLCAVVLVKTSTAAQMINDFIRKCDWYPSLKFDVLPGEWIITSVTANQGYNSAFDKIFSDGGITKDAIVKKGYKVHLSVNQEFTTIDVLRRIVDKLY